MAIRSVATTNTLEQFRTTFNSLGTDVGDLASLSGVSASTVVGAINELNNAQGTLLHYQQLINQILLMLLMRLKRI